jgi:hypothetical protein
LQKLLHVCAIYIQSQCERDDFSESAIAIHF